jgi:hypothetical protein
MTPRFAANFSALSVLIVIVGNPEHDLLSRALLHRSGNPESHGNEHSVPSLAI